MFVLLYGNLYICGVKKLCVVILTLLALFACTSNTEFEKNLDKVASIIESDADSACALLKESEDELEDMPDELRMRYYLLYADVQNKLDGQLPSDSLFREVVEYYDKNGSSNEQVKAHYLMGCIYRDLNEAPVALQCYYDAIDKADTLSADSLARLEAERLEAERARLEELINRIMLEDVYFDYDRSELTENAKRLLAQVAEILVNENRFIVTVEGHTDARGTEDYNISLGARRSTVVREFLIAYGVDANRLVSVSYGKERPKVQGTDETAYSKNRRAHFRVSIDQ